MNPTDSTDISVDPAVSQTRPPSVWLLPAVLIVIFMWIGITVPGMIAPLTMLHFISMQLGPILAALAMAIWWMSSRRIRWRERFMGLALLVASFLGAVFASHSSLGILMLVYGLPIALTLPVIALLLTRKRRWPVRRWWALAAFASILVASLFARVDKMDAAFAFNLVPRWTPTAEDQFLASLKTTPSAKVASDWILPEKPAANDWAEFRGPERDGVVHGVSFDTDWNKNPPVELWRRDVGPAWSSFCVVGPLLFTQEQRGETETVSAYETATGNPVWTHENEGRFEASMGGIGPRATPTYDAGQLFVTGANGRVERLDAATGDGVWSFDLTGEFAATLPMWGFASSPLLVDNLVIVFAGGGEGKGVVALDRDSGTLVWSASDGTHGYSSAQIAKIAGEPQVLVASNIGVASLEMTTGKVLWQHDWDIGEMARVTQPAVVGDAVYLSTGYGNGTQRIDVTRNEDGGWKTKLAWTANLKPYFNDLVHAGGHLYGFDGPIFMSVDAESGEKNWKKGRYGHGQVLLVADMTVLLVITEDGELVLVEANPDQLTEITRLKALDGVTWNHPVIAGGRLFVRNAESMVCYQLPTNLSADRP